MAGYLVAKSHHHVDQRFELPSLGGGTSIASRKDILRQWVSRNQPDISEAWGNDMYSLFESPSVRHSNYSISLNKVIEAKEQLRTAGKVGIFSSHPHR